MNNQEKHEIQHIPPKYRPITAWGYFFYQILFSIPVIGLIFLLIFSFSSSNIVRRSFARSYFCFFILIVIIAAIVITSIGGFAAIADLLNR
ncbi:MAG: hypothetical protein PHI19_02795 [Clostridia bacterium]|nr:hypothetical protein [Clostridia bacterium]